MKKYEADPLLELRHKLIRSGIKGLDEKLQKLETDCNIDLISLRDGISNLLELANQKKYDQISGNLWNWGEVIGFSFLGCKGTIKVVESMEELESELKKRFGIEEEEE